LRERFQSANPATIDPPRPTICDFSQPSRYPACAITTSSSSPPISASAKHRVSNRYPSSVDIQRIAIAREGTDCACCDTYKAATCVIGPAIPACAKHGYTTPLSLTLDANSYRLG